MALMSQTRFMRHMGPWLEMAYPINAIDGAEAWVTKDGDDIFLHAHVGTVVLTVGNGNAALCRREGTPSEAQRHALESVGVAVHLAGHQLLAGRMPPEPDQEAREAFEDAKRAMESGGGDMPPEIREALEGLRRTLAGKAEVHAEVVQAPRSDAGPTGMYV